MRDAIHAACGGALILGGFCLPFTPLIAMPQSTGLMMVGVGLFLSLISVKTED